MAKRKDDARKNAGIAEPEMAVGKGGETHRTAAGDVPVLTTQQGVPVADDQNSLKAGARGPTLLEDFHLREKIFHFDHERIPERVVHARGYGAHGYFENYGPLADVTRADLFQRKGEKTPVFVRFSTVAGNKGSADLARDVRGFAVKFYTKQGNWDLVGNNIPVFLDRVKSTHNMRRRIFALPLPIFSTSEAKSCLLCRSISSECGFEGCYPSPSSPGGYTYLSDGTTTLMSSRKY